MIVRRLLRRWNYETHSYEPYFVPVEWRIEIFSKDMHKLIDCAGCGFELPVGETYTSREIHNNYGIGYMVCDKCHNEEFERCKPQDQNS